MKKILNMKTLVVFVSVGLLALFLFNTITNSDTTTLVTVFPEHFSSNIVVEELKATISQKDPSGSKIQLEEGNYSSKNCDEAGNKAKKLLTEKVKVVFGIGCTSEISKPATEKKVRYISLEITALKTTPQSDPGLNISLPVSQPDSSYTTWQVEIADKTPTASQKVTKLIEELLNPPPKEASSPSSPSSPRTVQTPFAGLREKPAKRGQDATGGNGILYILKKSETVMVLPKEEYCHKAEQNKEYCDWTYTSDWCYVKSATDPNKVGWVHKRLLLPFDNGQKGCYSSPKKAQ